MSVKRQTIVATIQNIKRLASSYVGNPRYRIETDKGTFNTPVNSGIAYMIGDNWIGRTVVIRFDGRSSMRNLVEVTDAITPFAAALIANGVSEKHAIMWADSNELRAAAWKQGDIDIREEAEQINRIYAGI